VTAPSPRPRISPWKLGGLSPRALGRRVYDELWDDEIPDRAAALSYYVLFALFPMLLFLTTLLGLLPGPDLMGRLLDYVGRILPGDSTGLIQKTLAEVTRGASAGLLSVGAIGALWAASSGMASIMSALNVAYEAMDARPWWKRRLISIVLTVVFALFVLCGLLLLVFGEQLGRALAGWVGLGSVFTAVWEIVRWPVAIGVALFGISLIYYLAPAVDQPWYWVTPGSVFALVGWLFTSYGLRVYVASFANYNKTYGSIGGVILLLLWLYVTGLILLVGAEINAEIEQAAAERGKRLATAGEDLAT
jgi:membrane protein